MDDQEQEPWLVTGLRQTLGAPFRAFANHIEARTAQEAAIAKQQAAEEAAQQAARTAELRQMWEQIKQNGLFSLRDQPVQLPGR